MIDACVGKVKGFLLRPVESFRQAKTDEPGTVLIYLALLGVINAAFSAIVAVFALSSSREYLPYLSGAAGPVLIFLIVLAAEFVFTLLFAAWLHLWVYVVGGRRGILQTVIAVVYGSTPRLLLGWIPFVGILFLFWSLVLWVLGVRDLQELSTAKAVIAVAIAILIPLVILVILLAYLYVGSVATVTPVMLSQPGLE